MQSLCFLLGRTNVCALSATARNRCFVFPQKKPPTLPFVEQTERKLPRDSATDDCGVALGVGGGGVTFEMRCTPPQRFKTKRLFLCAFRTWRRENRGICTSIVATQRSRCSLPSQLPLPPCPPPSAPIPTMPPPPPQKYAVYPLGTGSAESQSVSWLSVVPRTVESTERSICPNVQGGGWWSASAPPPLSLPPDPVS